MDFVLTKVMPFLKKEDETIEPLLRTFEMKVNTNNHLQKEKQHLNEEKNSLNTEVEQFQEDIKT